MLIPHCAVAISTSYRIFLPAICGIAFRRIGSASLQRPCSASWRPRCADADASYVAGFFEVCATEQFASNPTAKAAAKSIFRLLFIASMHVWGKYRMADYTARTPPEPDDLQTQCAALLVRASLRFAAALAAACASLRRDAATARAANHSTPF